ncbi:MAG TPA: glycosyltransferase family 39 protein, partial [Polyangiaceae bacterium]
MEEPPLPPGNPLRPRSLVYAALGFAALVLLAATDVHVPLAVAWGGAAALVTAWGLLDFLGCFDDDRATTDEGLTLAALRGPLGELAAATLAWLTALRLAVAGVLPGHAWLAPLLVTLTSLGGVVVLARLGRRLEALAGCARSPWQRPAVWLLLLGVALYMPWLGSYSLLDPWETHYGEVAREMLARDDWLSLWWAQDGWFWSKPALSFWLQGLFFSLLGVQFQPDQLLAAAAHGHLPQPEWAARMPVVLLSLAAVQALNKLVARAAGKRAGFLAGLALLCMPYWALLSHQSMTDMPYVAPLTAALALFGLALLTEPEQQISSVRVTAFGRRLNVSGFHLLFGLVLLSSLPQLAYLLSRNLTLQLAAPPYGFRFHLDELFAGSGLGNCGLPGNQGCREATPANAMFQPALGALVFGSALIGLLQLNRGERRLKRLLYLAAWYCTALAVLAKGAPGLVLSVAVIGAVLCVRRQWQELTRVELSGLGLLLACVCLPWYVQEYMRHGEQFTDRLLFHDMYKRAFVHVH